MKTSWLPSTLLAATAAASSLTPPNLPLVVRNPYLSTWLQDARDVPWSRWPMFYTGQEVGLSIMALVPDANAVYPLLGRPQDSLRRGHGAGYTTAFPSFVGANYDASTTNFTYSIPAPSKKDKPLQVVVSFLSPITPTSSLRQSLPASYVSITAEGHFDIDVYMDLNGLWATGNRASNLTWSLMSSVNEDTVLKSWRVKRLHEEKFVEFNDRAEWGTLYVTGPNDARHECGTSTKLRQRFSKLGTLQNHVDSEFRTVMDEEPVFAFSKSFKLGSSINSTSTHDSRSPASGSVLFTISHVQGEVVQFAAARGHTLMQPLWKSYFFTDPAMILFHYLDFENAKALAGNYSAQVARDAYEGHGREYEDIVALSARQTLGATSFSGTPDDPVIFLKEISSNGNSQTVDVIFPSFPFFLYTNPRWLAYLLEPLLEHQLSGQYPNKYSMHDLGFHFPNMTGHPLGLDEYMPVEECGDMLIMGLALVNSLNYDNSDEAQSLWSTLGADTWTTKKTEDSGSVFPLCNSPFTPSPAGTALFGLDEQWGGKSKGKEQGKVWLKKSYQIWKQWTEYLIESSLEPANQLCTDDFAGWLPLQTNLGLKGIIGINAMSHLAQAMGNGIEAKYYKNISDTYVTKWQDFGLSRDKSHAKLAYNWFGSWTTLYSLFADAILCFHPSASNSKPNHVPFWDALNAKHQNQQPLNSAPPLAGGEHNTTKSHNFIPHSIYTNQSSFYELALQKYGLPLDSRHLYTKSDWEFEAAAVASPSLRREMITRHAKWINETITDRPMTDLYITEDRGAFPGPNFFARPVVGAHFSFLALGRACGGTGAKPFGTAF